ncbi:hypothetical protein GH714_034022 [Hevea brasiliensis]|uniref:Leucine-rich repeat-containing N-terminal plant-type domain-containing protein n=1 Tax=Hevea brasiliensis TaxID=3981 RepID=A0A6A6NCP7_HEVBR|nr:hypothetical protein GH714_034022 [Hevea brasiliensis]
MAPSHLKDYANSKVSLSWVGGNQFSGPLPECIGNLTNLQVLDLSFNQLSGNFQSVVSKLTSLKYLLLSGNEFEGLFTFSTLANHSKLEVFLLSSGGRRLELETENPTWFPTFQLKYVDLSNCNLNVRTRAIPSFLLYQYDIRFIDLSHNMLFGTFPSWILRNNSKLQVMNLMNNSFTGNFHLPNYKHDLHMFDISSNNITGVLPKEFGLVLSNLLHINMSRNNFNGNVPSSISEIQELYALDLSHNKFSGELPGSLFANCTFDCTLILSNNNLQGNIFPQNMNLRSLTTLDMKNNNFSAMIGVDFVDKSSLSFLDISNNKVSGPFPRQLCNMSSLEFLDLSENRLYGPMPSCFNASLLRFLFLQKNSLNGSIPHVLLRSPKLVALDVGDNSFSGNIPSWISQLSELRVLLLGGNKLHGSIPNQLCESRNVSIMDLSSNLLSGSIPSCFNNISFGNNISFRMMGVNYFYSMNEPLEIFCAPRDGTIYRYLPCVPGYSSEYVEVEIAMKYRYNSYRGDIINLMAGIDLSCNELSGRIPQEIGDLHGIRSLNLSNNHLTGSIPVSFSNLRNLESLDLGNNSLNGKIPNELVVLTFLETFNVSYNNSLVEFLIKGNLGLLMKIVTKVTRPLRTTHHRSCSTDETPPPSPSIDVEEEEEDEGGIDMEWFYWSFCGSYVTILLVHVKLDLHHNQFSGPLPKCIGNLTNLQVPESSSRRNSRPINEIVQIGEVDVVDAGREESVALSPSDCRRHSPFVNSQSEDPLASLPVFGPDTENLMLSPLNLGNLECCSLNHSPTSSLSLEPNPLALVPYKNPTHIPPTTWSKKLLKLSGISKQRRKCKLINDLMESCPKLYEGVKKKGEEDYSEKAIEGSNISRSLQELKPVVGSNSVHRWFLLLVVFFMVLAFDVRVPRIGAIGSPL